jgi:hypothetical protein
MRRWYKSSYQRELSAYLKNALKKDFMFSKGFASCSFVLSTAG